MSGTTNEKPGQPQKLSADEVAAAEAVLDLFTREHWDKPIPVIDEAAQMAVRALFHRRNMSIEFGSWPSNVERQPTINFALGGDPTGKTILSETPKAVAGPYFLGDTYHPEGVAIWTPITEPPDSRTVTLRDNGLTD